VSPQAPKALLSDVLIVDDTPANLQLLSGMLRERGYKVRPVPSGKLALQAARLSPPGLILLDINMQEMDGYEVCRQLKADPALGDVPVIFISANNDMLDKVKAFAVGGVDYVTKPFQFEEVEARVHTHLKIHRLQMEVAAFNSSLKAQVAEQVTAITDAQLTTILALVKLSECRDEDTGGHISRVQRYCKALAEHLAKEGAFDGVIDDAFIETIYRASALHDIGKVGIPDSVLLKPGKHTPEEWEVMKTHSALASAALESVLKVFPKNEFIRMGRDIARSHHERWDGSGYPDGLVGTAIPLCARILAVADQYDALRNKRPYKPAFDQAKTYSILTEGDGRSSPDHLDPQVLAAFKSVAPTFEAIYDEFEGTTD